MPIDEAWLNLQTEPAIDAELPICDPHHHLWDYPKSRYLLDDLLQDIADHNVCQTVFIECLSMYRKDASTAMAPVGETEFVQAIADRSAGGRNGEKQPVAGIIGFADLLLGVEVEAVLSAHRAASPNRFRGIRHACSWDESDEIRNSHTKPPPNLYVDTRFREGFSVLAQQKMVFDAWLYHPQIYELISLARAFPEVPIVLDHVGGPLGIGPYRGKREEVLELWKKNISELATCSNVVVKLGGLSMPICGFNWHKNERPPTSKELARATAPYILYCIEQFGTDRCMFESNFPVDKVSCSYTVLWNSFKRITQAFSAAEKADLFHDTAVKTYSLSA